MSIYIFQAASPWWFHLVRPGFTCWSLSAAGKAGNVAMVTAETADQKVCRMVYSRRQMDLTVLDFVYLVGTRKGMQLMKERHALGLFSMAQMTAAFERAGLYVVYYPGGMSQRGLYIAALHPLIS
jgi:hypothetical protein